MCTREGPACLSSSSAVQLWHLSATAAGSWPLCWLAIYTLGQGAAAKRACQQGSRLQVPALENSRLWPAATQVDCQSIMHLSVSHTQTDGTSAVCRVYAARGVVDGYGLLHELLADAVQDLFGQVSKEMQSSSSVSGATADTWTMVQSVTTEPCRDNAIGEPDACILVHDLGCVIVMHRPSCLLITSCGSQTVTASGIMAA